MIGLHDFVIEQKQAFNDTFKTESGLELHGDKRFLKARLSNRIATVTATPLLFDTIIKVGYQVMIDPTIYYSFTYQKGGKQGSTNVIDDEAGLYKISPSMIVLYREDEAAEWKGFGNNLFVEFIYAEPEEKPKTFFFIPEVKAKTYKPGFAKVKYPNAEILEMGATPGTLLAVRTTDDEEVKNYGMTFYIDGKEFFWIRNHDALAIIEDSIKKGNFAWTDGPDSEVVFQESETGRFRIETQN